jgi:phytoene synthase
MINKLKYIIYYYGKHYYYATLFFPKKIKEQTLIIYAFVRRLDNIVDDLNLSQKNKEKNFIEWLEEWKKACKEQNSKYEELNLFYILAKKKSIDFNYINAFIESMQFDLKPVRINTFKELEKYMYGSAVVVGYFMLYIFDCFKEELKEYATALAQAMQLTNFIRDIKEDLSLNRIYIPKEIYTKFNITEKDFFSLKFNKNFKNLIKELIKIAENLYKKSNIGIKKLPIKVQFPVFYASNLYKSILDEIKKNDYNIFDFKYKLKNKTKIIIFIKSIFKFFINKYA